MLMVVARNSVKVFSYARVYFVAVSGASRYIQRQGCFLDSFNYNEFGQNSAGTGNHYTHPLCIQECRALGLRYAAILRWNVSTDGLQVESRLM